ncbi:MAG TPA: response regulator [Ignavibacteriaceae bacterium]|nr:response regulator [Ignavibacteriaceae bacterium]
MKKILVIEDDASIHQAIIDILENEGFKVFSAFNGKAGTQLAKEVLPDMIICDIMMPGMSGYEVLTELRKDSSTVLIPFIFLSAMVERQNIRQGMELGADDYLTKPFKIEELLNAIDARFKKQELARGEKEKEQEKEEEETKVAEDGHIFLEIKNQPKLIKVNSILCITAYVDYTHVFLSTGEKVMVRRLLKKWEEILPGKIFLRIHRSTIINLNYILKVEKWFNHSFAIYLEQNEKPFIVSRRFSSVLKNKLHYK